MRTGEEVTPTLLSERLFLPFDICQVFWQVHIERQNKRLARATFWGVLEDHVPIWRDLDETEVIVEDSLMQSKN